MLAAEGDACRARAGVSLGFPSDVHRFLLLIILRKIPPTALALFFASRIKINGVAWAQRRVHENLTITYDNLRGVIARQVSEAGIKGFFLSFS